MAVGLGELGGLAAEEHSRLSKGSERKAAMPGAELKDGRVLTDPLILHSPLLSS